MKKPIVYPYIPNSVPEIRREMLAKTGVKDVDELFRGIPKELQYKRLLNLTEPCLSECELEKHVMRILGKNHTCHEYLNFMGAGSYQHHVPAVVDEIINRGEFLTAYAGMTYTDHGKFQAMFEYQSMLTELVKMEVCGLPTYDGSSAAGTALRMAARITKRPEVLVPESTSSQRMALLKDYCRCPEVSTIKTVGLDPKTGMLDLKDLKATLSSSTAGVYIENPSYLGMIEEHAKEIGALAHNIGALLIVGVNPISLGVLAAPGDYGADIVCGDGQPLGVHMNYGGGATGFVAVKDIPEHVGELPGLLVTILDLEQGGEGFGFHPFAIPERLSYMAREQAKEYTGTSSALWAIANAVYLALMGPQGMRDIGETIIQKSHYAKRSISKIPRVKIPFTSAHFNEFVVNFDATKKTVSKINAALLKHKIFGGKDLSKEFARLGQSALYCVSEIHSAEDIDKLVKTLREVIA